MREVTYNEFEAAAAETKETFQMVEERFAIFYQRTARPLWSYLARVSGNAALADDLFQESYCRFLASARREMSEEYKRKYLFRIATNLLNDHWRRQKGEAASFSKPDHILEIPSNERLAEGVRLRRDVSRALGALRPRERAMLWLAYVLGLSHKEIAEVMGLRVPSIRLLLFRARHKLADVLRRRGIAGPGAQGDARTSKVVRP
jgi:RNA polymerase sigma-70 factor (ECF subfamily)